MKNPVAAFALVNLVLSIFIFFPPLWTIPWTVVFAFVFFEALIDIGIGGGKGIFLIRQHKIGNRILIKQRTLTKGHAFLAFFFIILGVSFASEAMAFVANGELSPDYGTRILEEEFWNLIVTLFLYGTLKRQYFLKRPP